MRNLLYVLTLLLISISCQKLDSSNSYLKLDNEEVTPFFVTRIINTNHFDVYKGVHIEGDDINPMDLVFSIEIPDEQLNKIYDISSNDNWQIYVLRDRVLYRIFSYDINETKKSTCHIEYRGETHFEMDIQIYLKPKFTETYIRPTIIEFSYRGNVLNIDSDYNVIN